MPFPTLLTVYYREFQPGLVDIESEAANVIHPNFFFETDLFLNLVKKIRAMKSQAIYYSVNWFLYRIYTQATSKRLWGSSVFRTLFYLCQGWFLAGSQGQFHVSESAHCGYPKGITQQCDLSLCRNKNIPPFPWHHRGSSATLTCHGK